MNGKAIYSTSSQLAAPKGVRTNHNSQLGWGCSITSLRFLALFQLGMCSLCFSEEVKPPKRDDGKIQQERIEARQLLLQQNLVPLRRPVPNEQRDWIESWVFSGQTASAARAQLENAASQRISLVKSKCQLDEVQLYKIELAANGDIARFFREVDSLREEFKGMQPDRENMNEVSKKVGPVQQTWNRGMATSQSLFVGVLKSVLTPEQRARVAEERDSQLQERRRFQLMNFVKNVEKTIPFSAIQREQLMNSVGGFMLSSGSNSLNESYIAYVAATKIEPETLSEFLDGPQIEAFKKLQDHWRKNLPQFDQIQHVRRQPTTEDWLDAIR